MRGRLLLNELAVSARSCKTLPAAHSIGQHPLRPRTPMTSHEPGPGSPAGETGQPCTFGLAERRRSRTYQPWGYHGLPVLKTGWATGPVPLQGRRILRAVGSEPESVASSLVLVLGLRRGGHRLLAQPRAALADPRPELVGCLVGLPGRRGAGSRPCRRRPRPRRPRPRGREVAAAAVEEAAARSRRPARARRRARRRRARAGGCRSRGTRPAPQRRRRRPRPARAAASSPEPPVPRPRCHRPNYTRGQNRAASCSGPGAAFLIAAPRAARGCPVHRR